MERTLRSKHLRAVLWIAANGKCQICGRDLGDDWHADHIVPWCVSGRTNVHEMQALCKECNLKKGASMLRSHQRDFVDFCDKVIAGTTNVRNVLLYVTPGGGKSLIPVIAAAKLIRHGLADKLCWLMPRKSLSVQAEEEFVNPHWRGVFGHSHEIMRVEGNEVDPSRGTAGYTTTLQAIGVDSSGINRHEFSRGNKYILVLDEIHLVKLEGAWKPRLDELVNRAWMVILMTGSLYRNDNEPIAYLPYHLIEDDPVLYEDDEQWEIIRYTRTRAIEERAIVKMEVDYCDALSKWTDTKGVPCEVGSFDAAKEKECTSEALRTVVSTEAAFQIIDRSLDRWASHKNNSYAGSQLLVVAPNQDMAKEFVGHIKQRGFSSVGLAVSREEEKALVAIKQFRDGKTAILVTVGMAYIGMDVRSVTHICLLTFYRSVPWIEQVVARGTRFDPKAGSYENQRCWLTAPGDPELKDIIEKIKRSAPGSVKEVGDDDDSGGGTKPDDGADGRSEIIPEFSATTEFFTSSPDFGVSLTPGQTAWLEKQRNVQGLPTGISLISLARVIMASGGIIGTEIVSVEPAPATPSARKDKLRKAIEKRCRSIDRQQGFTGGSTNTQVMRHFRWKSRSEMNEAELREVWDYLGRMYPVNA